MQNRKQWEDEFELEHGLGRGPIEELIMSAARQAHARGREEERQEKEKRRRRRRERKELKKVAITAVLDIPGEGRTAVRRFTGIGSHSRSHATPLFIVMLTNSLSTGK